MIHGLSSSHAAYENMGVSMASVTWWLDEQSGHCVVGRRLGS